MRTKGIKTIRPVLGFEDDFIINPLGTYAAVFEMKLPEIYTLSKEDYMNCSTQFMTLFNLVPEFTVIHKMDIYSRKAYKTKTGAYADLLETGYNKKFNEREYFNHKCYLIVSKGTKDIYKNTSLTSLIFKNNLIPKDLRSATEFENFKRSIKRVETVSNDSGIFSLNRLPKEKIGHLCESYENLCFDNQRFTADIYQDAKLTKIGNNHISAVAVNSLDCLPEKYSDYSLDKALSTDNSSVNLSLFHPIGLGFAENHIVNQVFIKEEKEDVKLRMLNSDRLNHAFKLGDPSNEENIDHSDAFKLLMGNGHTPIRYHGNVIIWDKDKEKLESTENLLIGAFRKINFKPNIAFNEILPLYWSCYPGNASDIGYKDQTFYLVDRQAAALNIFETSRKDDISDFGITLSDRVSGIPLYVDISDLPKDKGLTNNRNKVIFGPSGSGKSFFTNHLLNHYLKSGAHIVTVDVGDSYERLSILNKGTYLKYNEDKPISFNPFYVLKENRTIEKKESLLTLIFTLWKKDPEEHIDEYAILSEGLNEYYKHIDSSDEFMCFNTFHEFLERTYFKNLDEKRLGLINTSSFFNVLGMFYRGGEYDYLLNSEMNIDLLEKQFIVFELDNIKDHPILFPVVTLMIMDTFISKMRILEGVRKVILIEEAWKAITKAGMASFMKYLYKTVRKHFGEAILVTQEVDDIVGNEIIQNTIIKNCGAKILLDQREYANDFDMVQTTLSLTEKAKNQVLSLNRNNLPGERYKEVFIALGNEGSVYGVNLSYEEYATYTTEKSEKEKIMKYYERYNDMELSIKLFAEELREAA